MDHAETYRGVPMIAPSASDNTLPVTPPPQVAQYKIEDSATTADYANFCRLSGTPEELLIDFGLNLHPTGIPTQPIPVSQRIVTGWHTAKRLLHALQLTVERHESVFGALETDIQKRVRHT